MARCCPTSPRSPPRMATRSPCFPPSVAADMARDVRLLEHTLEPGTELAAFAAAHPAAGGIASFIGKVRPDDGVELLELSHYEPLTLPGMVADRKSTRLNSSHVK